MRTKLRSIRKTGVCLLILVGSAGPADCAWAEVADRYSNAGTAPVSSTAAMSAPATAGSSSSFPAAATAPTASSQSTGPIGRSSLEIVSPQAQAHIDYALNLAERGAVQSAQAEFTAALDLIAEAIDADTANPDRAHAKAVQAGLLAIAETKDFVPANTPHNVAMNLAQLAATHRTPVLKNTDISRLTRAEALQRYHTYATQQLAFAGGSSPIASAALYGLGRAESVTTAGASTRNPLGTPNAMALYQAALLVEPKNYMASNELGVLMARYGDLQSSASQFEHSVSIKPQAETWHNLATVYRRMGQTEKAAQADREREKLTAAPSGGEKTAQGATDLTARTNLRWVDVDAFAATTTPYGLDGPPASGSKATAVAQKESFGKRWISKLNLWPKADKPSNTSTTESNSKADAPQNKESDGRPLFK